MEVVRIDLSHVDLTLRRHNSCPQYQNAIEEIYSRRVGITKDGVVFKQLRTEPVTYNPMNGGAECCCDIGRFPEEAHQSTVKVVPIDRIQDIKVEEPAGGTRQIVQCCGCIPSEVGELIPDVDAKVYISTAGDIGAELVVYGLKAPQNLRDTVTALKAGRPMPPPVDGVQDTGAGGLPPPPPPSANTDDDARSCYAPGPAAVMNAPGSMAHGSDEESKALLRSIDSKRGELIGIARAHTT